MNGKGNVVQRSSITLDGMPVTIAVERKRIKNMYLYVKPGARVVISAPLRVTDEKIIDFARSKTDWLIRQLNDARRNAKNVPLRYETGEKMLLWGTPHTLRVLPDAQKSFSVREGTVALTMPMQATQTERERYVKAQLKQRLLRAIRMRLPVWEKEMGLHASSSGVRDMKSRWGSCNIATGHLTFNLELIRLDPICLDYIIVHELAHLRHARHNRAFWALVARHIPDWKQIRNSLDHAGETAAHTEEASYAGN